jgi:hypothetical protein
VVSSKTHSAGVPRVNRDIERGSAPISCSERGNSLDGREATVLRLWRKDVHSVGTVLKAEEVLGLLLCAHARRVLRDVEMGWVGDDLDVRVANAREPDHNAYRSHGAWCVFRLNVRCSQYAQSDCGASEWREDVCVCVLGGGGG